MAPAACRLLAAARALEAEGDSTGARAAWRVAVAEEAASAVRARHGLARALLVDASCASELAEAESLLLDALRLAASSSRATERRVEGEVRSTLALFLAQSGREEEAAKQMSALRCRYRLGRQVLCYSLDTPAAGSCDVAAGLDCALPPSLLQHLCASFGRPDAPFWTAHAYSDPSTGYFSYSHKLEAGAAGNCWEQTLHSLRSVVAARFRPAAAAASHCEWWAHCRPHGAGHQLHYDSDAEGAPGADGAPRHPLASCVIWLDASAGGPTLVTRQRRKDASLASEAFLVAPEQGRMLVFDGSVLHGVIPGRGLSPSPGSRRVTLMLAFWDGLEIRPGDAPGASRPFPAPGAEPAWAAALAGGPPREDWSADAVLSYAEEHGRPSPLFRVDAPWEDVDAARNAAAGALLARVGMPHYDTVFQGF